VTNISKRLKSIVPYIKINDSIVDVGCDHGLLSIYLVENKLAKKVIASDINKNALASAIANVKASGLNIECVLSDGIKNVNLEGINTLVISGMGTSTIIHILEDKTKLVGINKIITQSNNNHYELRKYLNDIGYYLEDECYTLDKGKWYVTSCFVKDEEKNDEMTLKYGLLNNKDFNDYLLDKYKEILNKIPIESDDRIQVEKELKELEKAILQ
jgi:tRNA (adenine22-N1)-methyltransferase